MIAIIVALLIILVPAAVTFIISYDGGYNDGVSAFMNGLGVAVIVTVLVSVIFVPLAGVTGGFFENYSTGTREGFITKVSVKGFFWKTNEAQIQVGTGQMAALQEPFSFSISDPDMALLVESYLGERVRIKYKQWLIQPYKYGGTSYDCVSIIPIND